MIPTNPRSLWAAAKNSSNRGRPAIDVGSADTINEYFAQIATDPNYNPASVTAHLQRLDDQVTFRKTSEYEIYRLLSSQKKTAAGPDGIPYWLFKHCALQLTPVIANIINKSILDGKPPNPWKHAIVTPVPKTAKPSTLGELRPISVTSILSRLTERLIVQQYLLPAIPPDLIADQFAFRPSGSTTAALTFLVHHVTKFLEDCNYVRVLLIDYSKAFDSVNHEILADKLKALPIPPFVLNWIINFLTGRTQAVFCNGTMSRLLKITQSIVQGSGLGPVLYLIMASDLKTLSPINRICKYADDKTLMCPSTTDISLEDEFQHILEWSNQNKLHLNLKKTQEIIFRRPNISFRHVTLPDPLVSIERVHSVKLLGCILTDTLSASSHVDLILSIANQRLYLLNQFRKRGMSIHGISTIFESLVVSRVMYAVQAMVGLMKRCDEGRINGMFKKAYRWGLTTKLYKFEEMVDVADKRLFRAIQTSDHCLNLLLPGKRNVYASKLRSRGHKFRLPVMHTEMHKKSFINRCLYKFV